jgi:hypothetical protein
MCYAQMFPLSGMDHIGALYAAMSSFAYLLKCESLAQTFCTRRGRKYKPKVAWVLRNRLWQKLIYLAATALPGVMYFPVRLLCFGVGEIISP